MRERLAQRFTRNEPSYFEPLDIPFNEIDI
jgi:hypothetical protein